MKKKIYNQPVIEMAEVLQPMTIVCVSITEGPDAPGNTIGD